MSDQHSTADQIMTQIGEAVELGRSGKQDEARQRFDAIWKTIGPNADPFHRCTIAHYAADVQTDPETELIWDQRALAAADEVTDERARRHNPSLAIAGFYPSLHLNLAQDHRNLGDLNKAREHVAAGQASTHTLADDDYGTTIRAGLDRLADELDAVLMRSPSSEADGNQDAPR